MIKGELLGKGMTAEVYQWGKDRVLKLYFDRFSEEWIKYEANMGTIVHESGVPSPAVFEVIEVDGRKGIVFQKIAGKSMIRHIWAEPWNISDFIKQLAEVQFNIHQYSAKCLPSQNERFTTRIESSRAILGDKVEKILEYIKSLPDGASVCHGDLHFNNIIVSGKQLVPIDWANAYQGNPLGDVARTCLMMNSPAVKLPGTSGLTDMISQYSKQLFYWIYINEYMRLAKVRREDIDAWILPAAAVKLRDKIPGERKWLVDLINKRLKQ